MLAGAGAYTKDVSGAYVYAQTSTKKKRQTKMASTFVATSVSEVTITDAERSHFFVNVAPAAADYTITLRMNLNAQLGGLVLSGIPSTDAEVGPGTPGQTIGTGAGATAWNDKMHLLKAGCSWFGGWVAARDAGRGNQVFLVSMTSVLNSLFGVVPGHPLRPIKVKEWLEDLRTTGFGGAVFQDEQFQALRTMFVYAGKYNGDGHLWLL